MSYGSWGRHSPQYCPQCRYRSATACATPANPGPHTDLAEAKTKAKELEPWRPISLSFYSKDNTLVMNQVPSTISNRTFHSWDRQRTSRSIAQVLIRAKPPF